VFGKSSPINHPCRKTKTLKIVLQKPEQTSTDCDVDAAFETAAQRKHCTETRYSQPQRDNLPRYWLLNFLSKMEIEINFRFDGNGRTANTKNDGKNHDLNNTKDIDYSFKAEMTNLNHWYEPISPSSSSSMMDEILLDCEISDNLIMPRTYWMPADGRARCALEQFALDIFHHHVPSEGFDYDRTTSGAEWWCQLRPSPEMGRHNALQKPASETENEKDDPFANGISFHVDKDEELRILTGGSTYIHPHLSTITYLTNLGSPTLMMDCQVHPLTGEWIVPEETIEGFVSWPSVGKHASFDGRYLHASPLDLMGGTNAFEKQLEDEAKKFDNSDSKRKRRCRRVTFLVNIWLNYRPYDVNPFPESMIDKMSGKDKNTRRGLKFGTELASVGTRDSTILHVQNTRVQSDEATELEKYTDQESSSNKIYTAEKFSWPLGDKQSGERLECRVPLQSIVELSKTGGNVRIQWQTKGMRDCFRLFDRKSSTATMASPKAVDEIHDEASSIPSSDLATPKNMEESLLCRDSDITSSDSKKRKRPCAS